MFLFFFFFFFFLSVLSEIFYREAADHGFRL